MYKRQAVSSAGSGGDRGISLHPFQSRELAEGDTAVSYTHLDVYKRQLQAFQKRPDIFRRLLELYVGVLSPSHLALDGLSLGWGLLTA